MTALSIPIFPLHTVLFPGGLLPLRIFEPRYMDMSRDCLRDNLPFGVCLIREGKEVGAPAAPWPVGCLARITDWDMQQLGLLNLTTLGTERFRILASEANSQGLVRAEAELLASEQATALPARFAPCARLLELAVADRQQSVFAEPYRFDDAAWVGYRLAEVLPIPPSAKQELLELSDSIARLEILLRFIEQRGFIAE